MALSILQKARDYAKKLQQQFKASGGAKAGVERVKQRFSKSPSELFLLSPKSLGAAKKFGEYKETTSKSPISRAAFAAGTELIRGQERASKNIASGKPLNVALGLYQTAQPGIAASFGTPQALAAGALGGGLSSGLSLFSKQDPAAAFGRGFTQGFKSRAVTGITDPLSGKLIGKISPSAS